MSTALATVDNRHPMLRHLDEIMSSGNPDDECLDVSFMSRSFCLSGLPLRKQFEREKGTRKTAEPQREINVFSRNDERFSLTIGTQPVVLPGGEHLSVGLPYGAKARLLILWMTTQARANTSGDRWLEIGRIEPWLTEVGVTPHPDAVTMTKEQLVRLTFATFTMILRKEGVDFFRSDRLTEAAVFQEDDLHHYAEGNLARVRFPLGVELSEKAYRRFTSNDVIPVATEALRKISSSAMAIDILLYLSYRLPLIGKGDSELLTWKKLITQFGNGEPRSKFRQVFEASIGKALDAYQGADVDVTEEGLVLRYSDPAVVRKMFAVGAKKASSPLLRTRARNRIITPSRTGADNLNMELR